MWPGRQISDWCAHKSSFHQSWRGKEGVLPKAFRRSVALSTPWLWPLDFEFLPSKTAREKISFVLRPTVCGDGLQQHLKTIDNSTTHKEVKEQAMCISREWELLAERDSMSNSLEMEACLAWLRKHDGGHWGPSAVSREKVVGHKRSEDLRV